MYIGPMPATSKPPKVSTYERGPLPSTNRWSPEQLAALPQTHVRQPFDPDTAPYERVSTGGSRLLRDSLGRQVIKLANDSSAGAVAGSIAQALRKEHQVRLRACLGARSGRMVAGGGPNCLASLSFTYISEAYNSKT